MANTFKSAASGSTTSIQTLYTCPAATSGVVHAIYLSNIDGTNDATIKVGVKRSSTTHYIAFGLNVPAASSLVVIGKDNGIYLEEGDTLTIEASAAGDLSAVCSYEEITDD